MPRASLCLSSRCKVGSTALAKSERRSSGTGWHSFPARGVSIGLKIFCIRMTVTDTEKDFPGIEITNPLRHGG